MRANRTVVLITAPYREERLENLQRFAADLRIEVMPARSAQYSSDAVWHDIEVLYTSFMTPLPRPRQVPHLRWIQFYSAGIDAVVDQPLFGSNIILTTASGVHAIAMAEHALMMVLAWYHRLPHLLDRQRAGQWPPPAERHSALMPVEVWGQTLGVIGYGSVGRQVARLASGMGMRVLAMHRSADHRAHGYPFAAIGDPEGAVPERYYQPPELHAMLGQCDVVVIAAALTRTARAMFDDAAFDAMKPSALLVNIARGDICDEQALVRALEQRRIAGAALDVFHLEPLPDSHPLWHLPNVIVSPHVSGLTPHYDERAAAIFEENLRRYLAHQPLYNVVDTTQYL